MKVMQICNHKLKSAGKETLKNILESNKFQKVILSNVTYDGFSEKDFKSDILRNRRFGYIYSKILWLSLLLSLLFLLKNNNIIKVLFKPNNQIVSNSSIRLDLVYDEENTNRCVLPTCLQCIDIYGFILGPVVALIAISNYFSKFEDSVIVLLVMQLVVAVLLSLLPLKNILCNFRQSELIFVSRDL